MDIIVETCYYRMFTHAHNLCFLSSSDFELWMVLMSSHGMHVKALVMRAQIASRYRHATRMDR